MKKKENIGVFVFANIHLNAHAAKWQQLQYKLTMMKMLTNKIININKNEHIFMGRLLQKY